MYYWWYNGKVLYTISQILLLVIISEANYDYTFSMKPVMVEIMKQKIEKVGQTMKSINYEGEEGFFLSLKEQEQIRDFILSAEKVIQDANNS